MELIRSANHTRESEKRTATQRLELVSEEFWAWATTHATTMTHNSWRGHQSPVIWSFSHLLSQAITPIEIDIHSPSTSYSSRLFLYFSNLRWSSYRQITEVDLFIYLLLLFLAFGEGGELSKKGLGSMNNNKHDEMKKNEREVLENDELLTFVWLTTLLTWGSFSC